MWTRFLRNAASHHGHAISIESHIEKVEKQVAEAQKKWDKGERFNHYHIGIILGGISFLYAVHEAKKDKEHFITRFIAHHMTSDEENDRDQLNRMLRQQFLAENRLLRGTETGQRYHVVDPYLQERGSPF